MGLVSKLKNILFEEEEVEIPVLEKKEKTVVPVAQPPKEVPRKEEVRQASVYQDFYQEEPPLPRREVSQQAPRQEQQLERISYHPEPSVSRQTIPKEPTFNFPDFDEEEFESVLPRRSTNVMEHERKKEMKKKEYKAPVKKEEVQETKTKFRPSPIISPVYGILDKNYTPDKITSRTDLETSRTLDVDSVRKKAFGTLELEDKFEPVNAPVESNFDDPILEERLEKARTIDELLKDSSDDIIETDSKEEVILDPLDETIESLEEKKEEKKDPIVDDDSLESDLFDLIDSMYENREDGE